MPVPAAAGVPDSITAVSAQHVCKERASLSLLTQDGDVVRIQYKHRESDRVGVAAISADGTTSVAAAIDAKSSTRIRVEVEGTLDEGERAAIEDFLGKAGALADEFFNGNIEDAFAAGAAWIRCRRNRRLFVDTLGVGTHSGSGDRSVDRAAGRDQRAGDDAR